MNEIEKAMEEQQVINDRIKAATAENEREFTKVLTFRVGEKVYGIEIDCVIEILGVPRVTAVPGTPYYLKGVTNVRSKIVPVVNIRSRFGVEEIEFDERTCTIIIEHNGVSVGVIVDEVLDVLPVQRKQQADIPALEQVNINRFIQYILEMPDGIKLVLDIQKLLFDSDFTQIIEE